MTLFAQVAAALAALPNDSAPTLRAEVASAQEAWSVRLAQRCLDVLAMPGGRAGSPFAADRAVILRMLMRALGPGIAWHVPRRLRALLPDDLASFGYVDDGNGLRALPYTVGGAPELLFDARADLRRSALGAAADLPLTANTAYDSYASPAQKRAVHAALTAPPKGILLATLPTGAGKSLVTQLLALEHLRRGSPKLVLAVVPTVALAIDQHRAALPLFERRNEPERVAYIAGDSADDWSRRDLLERVRNGAVSLLFTGPERLVRGEVWAAVEACTRDHGLAALVLDEAHLVSGWGGRFRPAFQQMAEQRRSLLALAREPFPTILLSATVTAHTAERLQGLFASDGVPFRRVDARTLRAEQDYFTLQLPGRGARRSQVAEMIRHLPRPAIVYTTSVQDAQDLHATLSAGELAFHRISLFTGDTRGPERERIVDAWRDDELDLVIATSAFGLGVDKADVRVVMHATMPEGLDRFYQEAGRGGRDGFAAASCVLWTDDDQDLARRNAFVNVISAEKALKRWKALVSGAPPLDLGQRLTLDLTRRPIYDRAALEERGADGTVGWNLATLLLFERIGALRVAYVDNTHDTADIAWTWTGGDEDALAAAVEGQRDAEQRANAESLTAMRHALERESRECLAVHIGRLYDIPANVPCGRCAACRRAGETPSTVGPLDLPEPDWEQPPGWAAPVPPRLSRPLGTSSVAVLSYPNGWADRDGERGRLGAVLARLGVALFVAPEDWLPALTRGLAHVGDTPGLMLTRGEAELRGWRLLRTPTAIVLLPGDRFRALESALGAAKGRGPDVPVVLALPRDLDFTAQGGRPAAHEVNTSCRLDAETLAREWGV